MEPVPARPRGRAGNRAGKVLAAIAHVHKGADPTAQLNLGKHQLGCQASLYCPWTGSFLHKKFQSVFLSMFTDYLWRY